MHNNTTFDATNSSTFPSPSKLPGEAILAYNIYLTVSMTLGFLGNLLVLVVYFQNGTSHNTDWFIVFISIYDFISSVLNVPVYLSFTTGLWSRFGNDGICKIHMAFSQSTVIASPFLIGGLALERYFKVCRPTTTGLSKDGSRNVCISISVITFVLSVPCIALYDDYLGTCDTVQDDTIILINFVYYMVFVVVFIALSVILIFCYSNIALTVLRSKTNLEKYALANTHKNSERGRTRCVHIVRCIHRASSSGVRQEHNSKEIYVLPESSTDNDKVHNGNKSAKSAKNQANSEKVIKIRDKQSRINKSLRTTRITFSVCLIFLISWIPPWISFAINAFATSETKRETTVIIFQMFANMSFLINTFTNPIIYILMDHSFRTKMRKAFVCKC